MQKTLARSPQIFTAHRSTFRARVLESAEVHLNAESIEYDKMIRRHFWLLNQPFVRMLSNSGLRKGRVLDIGTGPGWIPIELALRHPEWEFWAVDASAETLAIAQKNAASAGVASRLHFQFDDATHLPFSTGSFDLVYSHFTLHHIHQPVEMLDEMARVTRGGGRIFVKDLLRLSQLKTACVQAFSKYVLRYNALQLRMYRESIDAALTLEEVRAILKDSRLSMARLSVFRGVDFLVAT